MEGKELPDVKPIDSSESSQSFRELFSSTNFWLITSLIVMVLSLVWFYYAMGQTKMNSPKPIPIVSASAVTRDVPIYLSALGNVTPTYNVLLRTQVNGILEKVFFKEGQLVKTGELLAQIDPRPYEALLTQYQGNLKRDSALLANARVDLQRYQRLWRQDSVSQQTLVTQKSLVEQYEGVVKSDEGLIKSTQINLNYCKIRSPIDGRIGLRLVDAGNFIQLSDTAGIAVINTLNPITVIFTLPEDSIPQLITQVYADKVMRVFAYDRQQNHLLAKGTLLTLDNQIDPTTGTVKLKATFENQGNRLFPNQFVNIKILVRTLKKAVLVPTAAIQHTLSGDFVYILDKKRVAIKSVLVGPAVGNETVIRDGLSEGQLVVSEGADKLIDGAYVVDEAPVKSPTPLRTVFNILSSPELSLTLHASTSQIKSPFFYSLSFS